MKMFLHEIHYAGNTEYPHPTMATININLTKTLGWHQEPALCISPHWNLAKNMFLFTSTTNLTAELFYFFISFLFFPCISALHAFVIPSSVWCNYLQANACSSQRGTYTFAHNRICIGCYATARTNTVSGHFQLLRGVELVFPLLSLHFPPFFSTEPSTRRWALPGIV